MLGHRLIYPGLDRSSLWCQSDPEWRLWCQSDPSFCSGAKATQVFALVRKRPRVTSLVRKRPRVTSLVPKPPNFWLWCQSDPEWRLWCESDLEWRLAIICIGAKATRFLALVPKRPRVMSSGFKLVVATWLCSGAQSYYRTVSDGGIIAGMGWR